MHASIQVIHKCYIGFKSSDLNGQGSTVTFWLARKSTVARTVCGRAENVPYDVHFGQHVWCQNLISVSSGVKVPVDVHQLSFSA
jgi:hypothetical protein